MIVNMQDIIANLAPKTSRYVILLAIIQYLRSRALFDILDLPFTVGKLLTATIIFSCR